MDVSDARKLKALEEESARLKKLLANLIIRERRLLRRQLERLRGGYDANGPERPIEDEQRQKIAELTSTANSEIPV